MRSGSLTGGPGAGAGPGPGGGPPRAGTLVWLVRHLATSAPPGAMIGASDPPLSPEGGAAALALGRELSGVRFDLAFSSPLVRAVATARAILGAGTDPPDLETAEGLREISLGRWEGLTRDEARRLDPGIWRARGLDPASVAPPGGESFADLAARVWPAFDSILARGAEPAQGAAPARAAEPGRGRGTVRILVVAHQAVNRVVLAREGGLPLGRILEIAQPPGAVTVISRPA